MGFRSQILTSELPGSRKYWEFELYLAAKLQHTYNPRDYRGMKGGASAFYFIGAE